MSGAAWRCGRHAMLGHTTVDEAGSNNLLIDHKNGLEGTSAISSSSQWELLQEFRRGSISIHGANFPDIFNHETVPRATSL
jgi:hypothetical protein